MLKNELEMYNLYQDQETKSELVKGMKEFQIITRCIRRSDNWHLIVVIDRKEELTIEEFEQSQISKIRKLEAKWKLLKD